MDFTLAVTFGGAILATGSYLSGASAMVSWLRWSVLLAALGVGALGLVAALH